MREETRDAGELWSDGRAGWWPALVEAREASWDRRNWRELKCSMTKGPSCWKSLVLAECTAAWTEKVTLMAPEGAK